MHKYILFLLIISSSLLANDYIVGPLGSCSVPRSGNAGAISMICDSDQPGYQAKKLDEASHLLDLLFSSLEAKADIPKLFSVARATVNDLEKYRDIAPLAEIFVGLFYVGFRFPQDDAEFEHYVVKGNKFLDEYETTIDTLSDEELLIIYNSRKETFKKRTQDYIQTAFKESRPHHAETLIRIGQGILDNMDEIVDAIYSTNMEKLKSTEPLNTLLFIRENRLKIEAEISFLKETKKKGYEIGISNIRAKLLEMIESEKYCKTGMNAAVFLAHGYPDPSSVSECTKAGLKDVSQQAYDFLYAEETPRYLSNINKEVYEKLKSILMDYVYADEVEKLDSLLESLHDDTKRGDAILTQLANSNYEALAEILQLVE